MEVFQEVTAKLSKEAKHVLGFELEGQLEKIENETQVRIGFSRGTYSFTGSFTQVETARCLLKETLQTLGYCSESEGIKSELQERNADAQQLPDYDISFASGESFGMSHTREQIAVQRGPLSYSGSQSAGSQSPYSSLSDKESGAVGGFQYINGLGNKVILGQELQDVENKTYFDHTEERGASSVYSDKVPQQPIQLVTPEIYTSHGISPKSPAVARIDGNEEGPNADDKLPSQKPDIIDDSTSPKQDELGTLSEDVWRYIESNDEETTLVGRSQMPEVQIGEIPEMDESSAAGNTEQTEAGKPILQGHERPDGAYGAEIGTGSLESEECFVDTDLLDYLMKVKAYELKDIERQFFVNLDCHPEESRVIICPQKRTKQAQLDIAKDSFINLHFGVLQNAVVEGMKVPHKVELDIVSSAVAQVQGMYANVLTKLDTRRKNIVFIGDRHLAVQAKREFIRLVGLPDPPRSTTRGRGHAMSLDQRSKRTAFDPNTSTSHQRVKNVFSSIDGRGRGTPSHKPPAYDSVYSNEQTLQPESPENKTDKPLKSKKSPATDHVAHSDHSDITAPENKSHIRSNEEKSSTLTLTADEELDDLEESAKNRKEEKEETTPIIRESDDYSETTDIESEDIYSSPSKGTRSAEDEPQALKHSVLGTQVRGFSSEKPVGPSVPRTLITASGIYIDMDSVPGPAGQTDFSDAMGKVYDSLDSEDSDEDHDATVLKHTEQADGSRSLVERVDDVTPENKNLEGHEKTLLESEQVLKFKNIEEAIGFAKKNSPQPEGEMSLISDSKSSLPGHGGEGTIIIKYNFLSGRQGPHHPSPSKHYLNANFTAYLPMSIKGQSVLKLLDKAFGAGLLFTVVPTKGRDVVTWRGNVDHKTDPDGIHGYPDAGFLDRVTCQLAAWGVTADLLDTSDI